MASLTQPLFGPGGRKSDPDEYQSEEYHSAHEDGLRAVAPPAPGTGAGPGAGPAAPSGGAGGSNASPVKKKRSDPLVAVRAGDIADQITDLKENFGSAITNFHSKQKVLEKNMEVLKKVQCHYNLRSYSDAPNFTHIFLPLTPHTTPHSN